MAAIEVCASKVGKQVVSVEVKTHKVVHLLMLQLGFYRVVMPLSHSYQLSNIVVTIAKWSKIDVTASLIALMLLLHWLGGWFIFNAILFWAIGACWFWTNI